MLGKLLKYDLKDILKFISVFYIITLFLSVATKFFINTDSPFILFIIGKILSGTVISLFVSIIINLLMRLWIKSFAHGLYGDEGYLTHTLPVTKSQIYLSKILAAIITCAASIAAIIFMAIIAYYTNDRWQTIKQILSIGNTAKVVVFTIIIVFLEFINLIQCGFTGIILGHKMNTAKAGFSVLFAFLVDMASQVIVLLFAALAALVNSDFKALFSSANAQVSESVFIVLIPVYLVIIIVTALINIKLLSKGVNVE